MRDEFLWMALISLLSSLVPSLHADPLAENQARIGVVTGDVGILTQGADDWIEPHEGLPLEVGDHLRTGEDGRVELVMSANTLWVLEPLTEVIVEHTETTSGLVDLSSGQLIGTLDTKRTVGTVQHWEFNTPGALVTVHGTEFALVSAKPEGTRVGVFSGAVDLQPAETAEGQQPAREVAAGQEIVLSRGKPLQALTKFSPAMQALSAKRPEVRRRQNVIENTWSPYTVAVKKEMRDRFVSAPHKHKTIHRAPARTRRKPPIIS